MPDPLMPDPLMTDPTPLDTAHAAMTAAPEDAAPRLAFHARLAEAELFLMLDTEPEGDTLSPRLFALEDGAIVLAFDSEARLAAFAGAPTPYAALPGRRLIAQLADSGIGLGLNFEVAPSAMLLPPELIDWLADTITHTPQPVEARPEALLPPTLPPAIVQALDARLARAEGLARRAWLAGLRLADGSTGHLLAIEGAAPGAEPTLARALAEALRLTDTAEATPVDITFLSPDDPLAPRLARLALRFDLPQPATPAAPTPPGSDPTHPPRLK